MSKGNFWGPLPVYILQDHRHKSGHLRVMGAILSCPQPYFPSLNEIAERSGHTPKYCSKMISEMVNFGTLEREQRYRDTNIYRLVSTPVVDATTVVDSDSTTVVELKESLKENKSNGMEPGYQRFCFTYPRHRLGVKRILHQYWTLNGLEKEANKIIRCVEDHKESDDWTSDSGKWVPGAQKFLEQERWIEYTSDPLSKFEED
jgi:hypothetical protein